MNENEQEFIENLLELDLTAYEARVYYVLFQLKYATVHDIDSACNVPRNKIYETLDNLEKKGFVTVIDKNPLRYACLDIDRLFIDLRKKEMDKLNHIEDYLKSQETKPIFNLESVTPHAYELHSRMAIESQLKAILRNTRKELYIGVFDAEFFNNLFTRQELRKLGKKIDLYIVIKDESLKDKIDYPCYILQESAFRRVLQEFEDADQMPRNNHHNGKLALISDRRNMMTIDIVNGEPIGSVMLTRYPFAFMMLFSDQKKYLLQVK